MKTLATKQPTKDSANQEQQGDRGRSPTQTQAKSFFMPVQTGLLQCNSIKAPAIGSILNV